MPDSQITFDDASDRPLTVGAGLKILRQRWRSILIMTGALFAFVVLYLLSAKPVYMAAMTIAPVTSSLASFADQSPARSSGVSLSLLRGRETTTADVFAEVMQSVSVAEQLQSDDTFMAALYGSAYDADTNTVERPGGAVWNAVYFLKRAFGWPEWRPPSPAEVRQRITGLLEAEYRLDAGMLDIRLRSSDPDRALYLLSAIFEAAENLSRERREAELSNASAYLYQQLQNRQIAVDHAQAFGSMYVWIEQQRVLLESGTPYQIQVIDPPFAYRDPVAPHIPFTLLGGLVASAFLACVIVFLTAFRHWL